MVARVPAIVVLLALALVLSAAATARQEQETQAVAGTATFVVSGRGWGHGVGMSQYGALGFARRGSSYARILAHYYPGTQLVRTGSMQVRVLLSAGRTSVTLSSKVDFRMRDATGKLHKLAAGGYRLGSGLKVRVKPGKPAETLPGPLTFMPGTMPLTLQRPYRGWIRVSSDGRKLQVINIVGLDQYLYGVVPDEVPHTWPAEALKAQAVAARSYALATRKHGDFDVYDDTRSQVYGGLDAETFPTTAAVDATAGQVLTYRGRPAVTYFFSTSGGRTAAIQDAWPGARPVPYLVSVPDPYDSLSPHHRWGPIAFQPGRLLRKLRVPGRLLDLRTTQNASGRVTSVRAVGSVGEVTVAGGDVRRLLGLRSTWFRIGVLSLTRPTGPAVYGSQARLAGVARGLAGVTLQQRAGSSVWEPASRIASASDGTFAVAVKPQATTEYRLASGRVASGSVRVFVAPSVRFFIAKETGALRGIVRPVFAARTVQIQRLVGTAWNLVETVHLDAQGRFEPRRALAPGQYRARVIPGAGFVPGTSPVLRVVSA